MSGAEKSLAQHAQELAWEVRHVMLAAVTVAQSSAAERPWVVREQRRTAAAYAAARALYDQERAS